MKWVTAFQNTMQFREVPFSQACPDQDALACNTFEQAIGPRVIHEFLFDPHSWTMQPALPALQSILSRFAMPQTDAQDSLRTIVWLDSACSFYPPAALGLGVKPQQLHLIRPAPKDVVWAATESLRCTGVAAVVALVTEPLSRVEARRLELAAEKGGGIGLLIRPNTRRANVHIYAAATRWMISPARGEHHVQRWQLTLIHGHGRHNGRFTTGQSFLLEQNRATGQIHFMHLPAALGDHATVSAAS